MKSTKNQQQARQEYKIMFITTGGAIITPMITAIANQRYSKKALADAFCAGVNAFRESSTNKRGKGNYLVVNANMEVTT